MKKKSLFLIMVFILSSFLFSGCFRHTHYWTVDIEIYNSTLKDCVINIDGRNEIIYSRTWRKFTIHCSDSEVYCDLFQDYRFRYNYYWDGRLYDSRASGSGLNTVWEDDTLVRYKLYYNNTTNIIHIDRI